MYNNVRPQLGMPQFQPQPPTNSQPNVLGSAFNTAGAGLIRGGLGAYGEKIFGSSSDYVQSNVCVILFLSVFLNRIMNLFNIANTRRIILDLILFLSLSLYG